MCIGDPSTYLTGVGLHDAITIMSLIFTVVTLCKTFWYCSWYILVAGYALSQQWFLNFLRKRRETIKKRNREGKRSINISLRVRNHTKLFQPYWRPRQLGVAKIMALWVINLSLCVWMEHEVCSYHYILLDQGYVPGIFGVSHVALQFMAYEELKKGYSQYFGTPINKKLVNTVCTCLYSWLYTC